MQHLDLPFNDLILSVPICSDQTINESKHIRKIVQVEPKQSPSNSEHRAHPAFYTLVFPVKDQSGHAANQGSYADENRKTSSAKTPLLPLAISKTVTKSDAAKIIFSAAANLW